MNLIQSSKTRITVFHCTNAFDNGFASPEIPAGKVALNFVKMPCSSMVKDLFLLRAFEAGADAVMVLVCVQGTCRYVEGNLRAAKRVRWVQALLDEIGLDGRRLALLHVRAGDTQAAAKAIMETSSVVAALGPNPAVVARPLRNPQISVIVNDEGPLMPISAQLAEQEKIQIHSKR